MAHLVALDHEAHRHIRIDLTRVEAAGAALNMVPVVLSEFLKLVVHYPIAFTKDKDTGKFACVALFGLHDNENLFVGDDGWNAIYVPLQVTRQPFFLGNAAPDGAAEPQFVVCLDVEHDSIRADEGGLAFEPIFEADGGDSPYLQGVKQGLAELLQGEAPTRQFIACLTRLNLLVPMRLEITFEDATSTSVTGLYTIDEGRLADLSRDDIASLHAQGYLGPVYTMLASLGHIYGLIDKRNGRHRHLARAA